MNKLDKILFEAASKFEGNENVNIVYYEEEEQCIKVGVLNAEEPGLPKTLSLDSFDNIDVEYYTSPKIGPAICSEIDEPNSNTSSDNEEKLFKTVKGGMKCGVQGEQWGTVTRSDVFIWHEAGRHKCFGHNAITSNAHVLEHPTKKKIYIGDISDLTTDFDCSIPMTDRAVQVDIATAKLWRQHNYPTNGRVLEIGQLGDIKSFNIGMNIRKYGAKTKLTTGKVVRKCSIQVKDPVNRFFHGVYETTAGFGCDGDSGAAIVLDDNSFIGIFTWSELIDCHKKPKGYFFKVNKKTNETDDELGGITMTFDQSIESK